MKQHGGFDNVRRAASLVRRIVNDFSLDATSDGEFASLAQAILESERSERAPLIAQLVAGLQVDRAIIQAIFIRLFRRIPEPANLVQWGDELARGAGATALITNWLASEEYFAQRAHLSNALFASVLSRDLMISSYCDVSAEIETRLEAGETRHAVVDDIVRLAIHRGWFASNTALRLGLDPFNVRHGLIAEGDPDPLRSMFLDCLTSDEYVESAADFSSSSARMARRLADLLVDASLSPQLADDIERDLVASEGPIRAMTRFARSDVCIAREACEVIVPGLTSIGLSELESEHLVEALSASEFCALRDGPLTVALADILDRHRAAQDVTGRLRYGDALAEQWEKHVRPLATGIVTTWFSRAPVPARRDATDRVAFWTERLVSNEYYFAVFAEFLASADFCGGDPLVFFDGEVSIAPPAGSLTYFESDIRLEAASSEGRMRLATTFFYWYDVHYHRKLISSPDDLSDTDRLSLTLQPPSLDDFSYLSFDWNRAQAADLAEAKIDVVLPVYYGTPFSDAVPFGNPQDIARNYRNEHADPGLRMIRRTLQQQRSDLRVGLFYDTTTLNAVNAKHIHVDFSYRVSFDWFYESIRAFFSQVPRALWALRDGRPVIFVYHPCFGLNLRPQLYPFVRTRFLRDFGVEPYIVTAAEEEAPRVLQGGFVESWARQVTFDNWREKLADLLAHEHLFLSAQSDPRAYAALVVEALLGQANGEACFQPSAVFTSPSGAVRTSYERSATESDLLKDEVERFACRANLVGRKAAVDEILGGERFNTWLARDWILRFLRVRPGDFGPREHALAAQFVDMLRRGEPHAACLQVLFSTKEFSRAAGGDDRVVDLVYQLLVWRYPNPEYVNNHSTIDDTGRREFEEIRRGQGLDAALRWFLARFEVAEAVVSDWLFKYYRWYNPGPADSSFYWGGAIAPIIRDVAAVGPGYDQSALLTRPQLVQPRHEGRRYRENLAWVGSMFPQPWLLHIETWNEFFEGTCICECAEFGRQYMDITSEFADELAMSFAGVAAAAALAHARSTVKESRGTEMSELQELFEGIYWHQRWEVAPGVFTPGQNDVSDIMHWTMVPQSLAGKRVLDIGSWNGCFAFECERRGASEILAIGPEPAEATGFARLKKFLNSKAEYRQGTIYDLQPENIGVFDVVLCFGVLYHLRYPLLGMDMIRRVARGDLHLETYANIDGGPAAWQFFRKDELNHDPSNWFAPNRQAVDEMLHSSGFKPISLVPRSNNRITAYAKVSAGQPEWLTIGSGEGVYYDVITKPVLGSREVYERS